MSKINNLEDKINQITDELKQLRQIITASAKAIEALLEIGMEEVIEKHWEEHEEADEKYGYSYSNKFLISDYALLELKEHLYPNKSEN